MNFQWSKSTLDSLRSIVDVFKRTPALFGAPDLGCRFYGKYSVYVSKTLERRPWTEICYVYFGFDVKEIAMTYILSCKLSTLRELDIGEPTGSRR